MAKLTSADIVEFERQLKAWQARLNLGDWRIVLSPTRAKSAMAEMDKWDWQQRQVTCRVGEDWKATPVNHATLAQTAVHELLHVMLFELIEAAKNNQITDEQLGSIEHRVINTLERLLVPDGE